MVEQSYSRDEVYQNALEYFEGDTLCADVWLNKYALKDSEGNIYEKTPDDMFKRLASELSRIENNYENGYSYDEIYESLKEFKYIILQGSPLAGIGNDKQITSLGNCFVVSKGEDDEDSYGNILKIDEELAQLMKRRCVEENSKVDHKNKGIIPIKDVEIGDEILSYNKATGENEYKKVKNKFYSDVDEEDRVEIKLNNGTILKTSKKHPVLTFKNDNLEYIKAGEINQNDNLIKPKFRYNLTTNNLDKDLIDIGWFIGTHQGDGNSGWVKHKSRKNNKEYIYHKIRIRNYGDNENIIKEYTRIYNALTNKNINYKKSNWKNYKSDVWGFSSSNNKNKELIDKYFDGKTGSKVYTCNVPNFIKENDLWIPFLAGLIDADGHVRGDGTSIHISLASKNMIDDISSFLSSNGISYNYTETESYKKNSNEVNSHRLTIHHSKFLWKILSKHLIHDKKKYLLENASMREWSNKIQLTDSEVDNILNNYKKITYGGRSNNLSAIISLLKKGKSLGKGGINELLNENLIDVEIKENILERILVEDISKDEYSENYIDLEVEDNNNFFSGNFGLVNIHNCGVGIDLSFIRPKGTFVKNSALTSTGVVPFMERYSNTTREVAQDGRRGALMETINIKHPDAESFIDAKMEKGKVTGANVSVKITDAFIKAVRNNEKFIQQYPVNSDNPNFIKEIDAKDLWDKIVKNAHNSAEPGLLLWDNVIRESIPDCYADLGYKSYTTNPCFSGNEFLLTDQGYKTFEELADIGSINIINKNGNIIKSKVWKSGVKNTIKLKNTQNEEIICTPDHIWMDIEGNEIKAENTKGKRLMPYLESIGNHDELFVKLGFIQGDGNLGRLNSETHKGFEINIGENDDDVLELFGYNREYKKQRKFYTDDYYTLCEELNFDSSTLPIRNLPKSISNWNKQEIKSFLKGLFSANGSIINNHRISYKSTNKQIIEDLQLILNNFNISSYYTTNKEKDVEFSNGTYKCKESYDLNIGKYKDLIVFYNEIGFIHDYKNKKLRELIINKSPIIRKIENYGEIDVYDFNEPETHWGIVNGYIAHNCGEIILGQYSACRLTALNLYSFVKNPFTKDSFFDFDLFYDETYKAQKIMDDIVDLEIEKVDQIINKINNDPESEETKRTELNLWENIKDKCKRGRRTGLGATGLGDMLAALGYTYGTDKANKFADKVYMNLKHASYESSIDMAKDRGSFPIYEFNRETENPFLNRIKDEKPELYEKMEKYGRRNIALLTTAPTGSISLLAKVSSGVECTFLISYKRRRKINPNDKDSRIDFTDEIGDKWQEYHVFHHKFEDYLKIKGYDIDKVKNEYSKEKVNELIEKSPYHNATTNDVNWVKKVEMQGMLQKHIDHSISVTVNLPQDITVEKVKEVYQTAYDWGCKGVTIYRDGSRSGVLISNEEKQENKSKEALKDIHAPKRPKILEADVVRFNNNKEKWIAFVGLYNNRPYEIFTGKVDETEGLNISNSIEKGEIIKIKKGDPDGISSRYDFRYKDKDGYNVTIEGISRTFEPEYWNYLKIISSVLRHGMPLQYVYDMIERLNLDEESLNTWKKGVARVIKKYIPEGTKYGKCPQGEKDEDCGLVFKEGCLSCDKCGLSKC